MSPRAALETERRHDPIIGALDAHLLAEGRHWFAYRCLGAHRLRRAGAEGTAFVVWAPNADAVSVVGDFNGWDPAADPMRPRPECGCWERWIPDVAHGARYKFALRGPDGATTLKADPYARWTESAPATASRVLHDDPPPAAGPRRARAQGRRDPIAIYEIHAGSWRRHPDGRIYTYAELADALVPYVRELGFTHIELLPIAEHPFGGSWGYQCTALYAPSSRHGTPDGFRAFVARCHEAGIGVLLDWVPAHFPDDPHALGRFDGTCLYEHEDPRQGRHREWNTLIYNYGRREVANFLIANALYWLREYDVDGLRVDAVASMLYLDYGREPGDWLPNRQGGRENLEAVEFLRRLNTVVHRELPDRIMVAEESSAWPGVTAPADAGGLGFDYKWDLGWMHDRLAFLGRDPVHRRHHHRELTFRQLYAHSECYVLPLSHDEVVHGKRALLDKMPGDPWQRLANLRLGLACLYLETGKKLLFMGGELAQEREWDHDGELDWAGAAAPGRTGVARLVRDLNRLYRELRALHGGDCGDWGFRWVECHDEERSVFAWRRHSDGDFAVVVCNFTPEVRRDYRIGVPRPGRYRELLNTDATDYDGSGAGNLGLVESAPVASHGEPVSVSLTLPPLAALVLVPA